MSGSNGNYEDDGGSSRPAEPGVRRCERRCERQSGSGLFPTGESKSVPELAVIANRLPCSMPSSSAVGPGAWSGWLRKGWRSVEFSCMI